MAIILQSPRMTSGLTGGYLTIRKPQSNQILNALAATPILETPTNADVASYGISVSEIGSMGIYSGTLTTGQAAALSSGMYVVEGSFGTGTAAVGDLVKWSGTIEIDGANVESFPLASSASNASAVAMSGANIGANVALVAGQTASASAGVNFDNLANVGEYTIRRNTCQAGSTSTTIVFDAGASAVNNFYNDQEVIISSGTGAGQSRLLSAYNGSTKTATVSPAWAVTPDNTSHFIIVAENQVDLGLIAGQPVVATSTVTFPTTFGTSTLTQSQITGGAYSLNTDSGGNIKLSTGTGANQIILNSGVVNANVTGGATVLSPTTLTVSASTTPTNSSDVGVQDSSQVSSFSVVAPAGAAAYWKMYGRAVSGGLGILLADGSNVPPSNGSGYPVPANATNHYLNVPRQKIALIYFSVWLSAGTGNIVVNLLP